MTPLDAVRGQYLFADFPARVRAALDAAGPGPLSWRDLAQLDQFHVRGVPATEELAAGLDLRDGERVLDVGSGLGGPARYLAAVHGCHVTGVELQPDFVAVADELSRRTGLADRTRFVAGDATELPFPPGTSDHAWTQHVTMNIADKDRLYRSVHRAVRPGGRFASYDVVAGDGQPVIYPVPWAADASISFWPRQRK